MEDDKNNFKTNIQNKLNFGEKGTPACIAKCNALSNIHGEQIYKKNSEENHAKIRKVTQLLQKKYTPDHTREKRTLSK